MKLRDNGLGKNHMFTKRLNRQTVLDLLRREPSQSRAELARVTQLSPQSLSNIIGDLERAGLIEAAGKVYGGKGQPPTNYRIVPESGFGIGLHLERDMVRASVLDFAFRPKANLRREVDTSSLPKVHRAIDALVETLIDDLSVPRERVWGIGIASPRLRDAHDLDTDRLEGSFWSKLRAYELDRRLAEEKQMAVVVENDANAGALAELTFGKGRSVRDFCYLFLGHGLGAGFVHDGALFRGGWTNAGEVGRILVDHQGKDVFIESILSVDGLLERLNAGDRRRDDVSDFARLVEAYRPATQAWIAEAAKRLRWLVSMLENTLDPHTIILGGDLPEWVIDELIEQAEPLPHTIAVRSDRTEKRLQKGLMDRDMIALGAAAMPLLATIEAAPAERWDVTGVVPDLFAD